MRNAFHLGVSAGVLIERLGLCSHLFETRPKRKIIWVLPKVWKLAVLGTGNATKEEAIEWAETLGPVASHDEAEARALAVYGYQSVTNQKEK